MRQSESNRLCFVIMPFASEFHYFYLALKLHIERAFRIVCERADEQVLTIPVLEKINDYILQADVIIADLTTRNRNVFYELGMAHTHGKSVILITSDQEGPPTDVRHFGYIRYKLGEHTECFGRLDNALRNILFQRYEALHERAREILDDFRRETKTAVSEATKDEFVTRVMAAEVTTAAPLGDDLIALAGALLPRIVADPSDLLIMEAITRWITRLGARGDDA